MYIYIAKSIMTHINMSDFDKVGDDVKNGLLSKEAEDLLKTIGIQSFAEMYVQSYKDYMDHNQKR